MDNVEETVKNCEPRMLEEEAFFSLILGISIWTNIYALYYTENVMVKIKAIYNLLEKCTKNEYNRNTHVHIF